MKDQDVTTSHVKDIIKREEEHQQNDQVLLSELIASPLGHTDKQHAGPKK